MNEAKIGVILSSFHLPLEESLKKATQIGIKGIQLWNVGGELDPRNMSKDKRERFTKKASSLGLTIIALCGDIGGFTEESNVKERIKRTKEFLDLSIDLRTPIVTTHIGIIPKDKNTKERKIMQEALKELGEYGERIGTYLAAETGPESPELMKEFFEEVNSSSLKINYDPANLIMKGYDPVKGVHTLKDYIVHTHVKDGKKGNGETPLGEGDVPFGKYIKALKEIDYDGFFTIERETGNERVADIVKGKEFLEKLLQKREDFS